MIALTTEQKIKLINFADTLKRTKSRTALANAEDYALMLLKKIFTDGVVAGLDNVPELKKLLETICKIRNESVAEYVKAETPLFMESPTASIKFLNHFKMEYKRAQKLNFSVSDSMEFYKFCKKASECFGRTPEEMDANFFLHRINKNANFSYRNLPPPTRENLLVFCVDNVKQNKNPIDQLPISYKVQLAKIIAKNESMTISEWIAKKVALLARGESVYMPYMISSNKQIRLGFKEKIKNPIEYSNKVNNYIRWNNLPQYFAKIFPHQELISNYFFEPLTKPKAYTHINNLKEVVSIGRMNPRNYIGLSVSNRTKAAMFDLLLFVGDSYNISRPTKVTYTLFQKYKEAIELDKKAGLVPLSFSLVKYIKKYDDREIIDRRYKFLSTQANISIAARRINFLEALNTEYPDKILPCNFFDSFLGYYGKKLFGSQAEVAKERLAKYAFTFETEDYNLEITETDDVLNEITTKLTALFPDMNIPYGFKKTQFAKEISEIAKMRGKTLFMFTKRLGFKMSRGFSEQEILAEVERLFPNKKVTKDIPIKLRMLVNSRAIAQGTTYGEYLKKNGFEWVRFKHRFKNKALSEINEEELLRKLKREYKNGVVGVGFSFTDLGYLTKRFASKKNIKISMWLENHGFVYLKNRKLSEQEAICKLQELFPERVVSSSKIPGTLKNLLGEYAKLHGKYLGEYIESIGFEHPKQKRPNTSPKKRVISYKNMDEADFIRVLKAENPTGDIHGEFHHSKQKRRAKREAEKRNISLTEYLKQNGLHYEDKRRSKRITERELFLRMEKVYPGRIIDECLPTKFRNLLMVYVKEQNTNLYDYLAANGFVYQHARPRKTNDQTCEENDLQRE